MNRLSTRCANLERSRIRMFSEKLSDIAAQYDDVISFAIGEPDFIAPKNIEDACVEALRSGKSKYAPNAGLYSLREAISEKAEKIYGNHYDPETQVLITPSGMDSLRMVFQALLDEGDEVIVPDPTWSNHPNHPVLAGGVSVCVPVRESHNFTYEIADLEQAVTPRTKAILLNSPSNPTGAVIHYDDLSAICEFAKRHDLIVVSDEVYYNIIFDGEKFWSPSMLDGMKERTIIVQSFSKTYAMTGWRLGYLLGPSDLILGIGKINENSISCVNTFVQIAGIEALSDRTEPELRKMVEEFQRRRDVVYKMINEIPGLSCAKPHGAFYAFVNIQKTGIDSETFANELLQEKHVGVVPGNGFGQSGEGFIRLSYATSIDKIVEGIGRIANYVKEKAAAR